MRESYKVKKTETFCVMATPRFPVADWEICWAQRRSSGSPCKEESKFSFGTCSNALLVLRFLCAILAALIPVISTKLQPEVSFPVIYGLR